MNSILRSAFNFLSGTIKGAFFIVESLVDIGLSLYLAALSILLFALIVGSILGALL